MPLRRLIFLSSLVLAVAALSPAAALGKAGGTDRPISARGSITITANVVTGAILVEGQAVSSHLGKVTTTGEGANVPAGPGTLAFSGTQTIVAANGDELTGTFSGTATGFNGPNALVLTITGGTGRFEDASGTLTFQGQSTLVSFEGVTAVVNDNLTGSGQISY